MRSMETESFTGDYSSDNFSKCLREFQLEFSGGEYVSNLKTGTRNQVTIATSIYWACDTALEFYTK